VAVAVTVTVTTAVFGADSVSSSSCCARLAFFSSASFPISSTFTEVTAIWAGSGIHGLFGEGGEGKRQGKKQGAGERFVHQQGIPTFAEVVNNKPMLQLFFATLATLAIAAPKYVAPAAAPNYIAERDPPRPEAQKQYRLWLRTPGRPCNTWRKITPIIPREDMLLSDSKRDETGKEPGCKFTFVIKPATEPGDMKFEMEGATGPKEFFEVPGGGKPKPQSFMGGIANENGTGMASGPVRGKLKLGGEAETPKDPAKANKNLDTGTGL
jgi:hypothetical protein